MTAGMIDSWLVDRSIMQPISSGAALDADEKERVVRLRMTHKEKDTQLFPDANQFRFHRSEAAFEFSFAPDEEDLEGEIARTINTLNEEFGLGVSKMRVSEDFGLGAAKMRVNSRLRQLDVTKELTPTDAIDQTMTRSNLTKNSVSKKFNFWSKSQEKPKLKSSKSDEKCSVVQQSKSVWNLDRCKMPVFRSGMASAPDILTNTDTIRRSPRCSIVVTDVAKNPAESPRLKDSPRRIEIVISSVDQSNHIMQQDIPYTDPLTYSTPSFQRRIAEIAALECETKRWERSMARMKKKQPAATAGT